MIKKQYTIALIDSGISPEQTQVKKAFSIIDDNPFDLNGHGTNMIDIILNRNPQANIISIKAFDENFDTKVENIITAIKLAIKEQVDIINMSFSAPLNKRNKKIIPFIQEALDKNIKIIAAAGNDFGDSPNYKLPACLPGIITAASGKDFCKNSLGAVTDYTVIDANTSSEATAKISARLGYDINSNLEKFFDKVNSYLDPISIEDIEACDESSNFRLNATLIGYMGRNEWGVGLAVDTLSGGTPSKSDTGDVLYLPFNFKMQAWWEWYTGTTPTNCIVVGQSSHVARDHSAPGTYILTYHTEIKRYTSSSPWPNGQIRDFSGTLSVSVSSGTSGSSACYLGLCIWQVQDTNNSTQGAWRTWTYASPAASGWTQKATGWNSSDTAKYFFLYRTSGITMNWSGNGLWIYNGSAWKAGGPHIYNGSAWKIGMAWLYNGSAWKKGRVIP